MFLAIIFKFSCNECGIMQVILSIRMVQPRGRSCIIKDVTHAADRGSPAPRQRPSQHQALLSIIKMSVFIIIIIIIIIIILLSFDN